MDKELKDKVSIVTGAGRGIGKAISLNLANKGSVIAVIDINETDGRQVCSEIIRNGGEAIYFRCDVKNEDEIKEMATAVINKYGKVDTLVNNAGIVGFANLWETPTEVWDNILNINLRGTFLCTKHIVPYMINQKSGSIINISSAVGKQALPMMSAYGASKAGIIAMTVALAKEVAPYGVTVNAVCPGPIDTTLWDESKKVLSGIFNIAEQDIVNKLFTEQQLIKVPLTAEDIAATVAWLTASETKMVTGQAISMDGGFVFPTF